MKPSNTKLLLPLLVVLALYVGSYVLLRSAGMYMLGNRASVDGRMTITLGVSFGNGVNRASDVASTVFFPLIHVEHYFWPTAYE